MVDREGLPKAGCHLRWQKESLRQERQEGISSVSL